VTKAYRSSKTSAVVITLNTKAQTKLLEPHQRQESAARRTGQHNFRICAMDKLEREVALELAKMREDSAKTLKENHAQLMLGVNSLVRLSQSRLMDVAFLRVNTLRDPSLDERGCDLRGLDIESEIQTFFQSVYKGGEIEYENMASVRGDEYPPFETYRCNGYSCGFKEHLEEIFRADPVNPVTLICCPRHQLMLENTLEVGIIATLVIHHRGSEGVRTFANLVCNGRKQLYTSITEEAGS
jgi:hypothetical protein